MSNDTVIGILLAAGNSSRFGSNKLLHPIAQENLNGFTCNKHTSGLLPIAQLTARQFRLACDKAIAVIKPDTDRALETLLKNEGFDIIVSTESIHGMGNSIAAGVLATLNAKGWMIALADMPFIKTETYQKIANELRNNASIAVPTFEEKKGHPVAFSKQWQKQLASLTGDTGARSLLTNAMTEITFVPVNDLGILHDIDCQADLIGFD